VRSDEVRIRKAVGFYRHTGFAEIPAEKLYPVTGVHVLVTDLQA
jgi:hypothetical protein